MSQFSELPAQLQPNQNGLTPEQFQVYEDFSLLNKGNNDAVLDAIGIRDYSPSDSRSGPSLGQPTLSVQQKVTQILSHIDQNGLDEINKNMLYNRLQLLNRSQMTEHQDDRVALWAYVKRYFEDLCKNFENRNAQQIEPLIEILSLIVKTYTVENFSSKLLTKVFLQLDDVSIFNNLDLNILLMSKGIISISEWDVQIANLFKEDSAELQESELQFFANVLQTSIVQKEIFTKEDVPQLIAVIESMVHDRKIGTFCQQILDTIGVTSLGTAAAGSMNYQDLKNFFIKWVKMSYVDDKANQEKEINTLFEDLGAMGIEKSDSQLLFNLTKVMVKVSIEKALYYGDESGERRPADRLDFRYIDSFVKLIVMLLKMLNNFNVHELMSKTLDIIKKVLEEDHQVNKGNFNQRPYYRMLFNIMAAFNHPDCFNQKIQQQILYSMADLFKSLNPMQFPGFCFAWLELISHKQFLPNFLKQQPQPSASFSTLGSPESSQQMKRREKIRELIVCLFTFLKINMIQGQPVPPAIQAFYHATLRVVNVIRLDFPDFLSEYHFNFVNNIPDHCLQLRNLILYACPSSIPQPDPFLKNLKIDKLDEIKINPTILSNYENYLQLMNLREDLENYTRTRNTSIIKDIICTKMEQSEEVINGHRLQHGKPDPLCRHLLP